MRYIIILLLLSGGISAQISCDYCAGDTPPILAANCSGGTGNITTVWTKPDATTSTAATLPGDQDGIYSYTCTDANGCTSTGTFDVIINTPFPMTCRWFTGVFTGWTNDCIVEVCNTDGLNTLLDVEPASEDNNCFVTDPNNNVYTAAVNGAIIITDAHEIAGTWVYSCTQTNGCVVTTNFTMIVDDCDCSITPTALGTDITCNGLTDGIITVTENGVAPYTYAWTGGASGNPATGLAAGTYTVTVTDDDGCTGEVTATVGEPPVLVATCTGTNILCNEDADGTATVVASGGTAGYTYLWDDPAAQTTATAIALVAGTYTVTVTDANGCTETCSYIVTEANALTSTPNCN